jgi:hypothetical protein
LDGSRERNVCLLFSEGSASEQKVNSLPGGVVKSCG